MRRSTRPPIVAAPQWRDLQRKGQTAGLARFASIEKGADGLSFVASTDAPDRYGDTVDQTGWDTASFEANPVLLWAHDYSKPPVGKVGQLDKSGNLTARAIEFTPKEMNAFGAEVGAMVEAKFLNTVSVGFLPKAWEERYDEGGRFLGYHFKSAELLEISVVPVPANPQALAEGRAFAKSLTEWASAIDDAAGPLTKSWGADLATFAAAAEKVKELATDEADADSFAKMLVLLERIAASTEATQRSVVELVKARGVTPAGASTLTLAEALKNIVFTPHR